MKTCGRHCGSRAYLLVVGAVLWISLGVLAADFSISCDPNDPWPLLTVTEASTLVLTQGPPDSMVIYGHDPETLQPVDLLPEFIVRHAGSGEVLARLESDTGRLYIRGQVLRLADHCLPVNAGLPDFVVADAGDYWRFFIDQDGNLGIRDTASIIPPMCIHQGTPQDGSLDNAVRLPAPGTGYYHYVGSDPPEVDDWGAMSWIHEKMRLAGLAWSVGNTTPFGVGDISLENGGDFGRSSHQNGRDVDIRYVRNDGNYGEVEGRLDLSEPAQFPFYDQTATQELINILVHFKAELIFVDPSAGIVAPQGFLGLRTDSTGVHANHFHVRFADPDGNDN